MCALFGLLDYAHFFSRKQRIRIIKTLATECEIRGTDATGFAYTSLADQTVFTVKNAVPAHKLHIQLPASAMYIMGHTRMETQGSSKFNYNNHPFLGVTDKVAFALAHNGVLYNNAELKTTYNLPVSEIETDSYVAVQLIEKFGSLDFNTLSKMAETVYGTFAFTLLDSSDNFYFVRGSNPLALYKFDAGFYVYASTKNILDAALLNLNISALSHTPVDISCGDIVKISSDGTLTRASFDNTSNQYDNRWDRYCPLDNSVIELLEEIAVTQNIPDYYIDILIDWGYEDFEIYDLLQTPDLLMREVNMLTGEFKDYPDPAEDNLEMNLDF